MKACVGIFASIAAQGFFQLLAVHLLLILLNADRHIALAPTIHLVHV
jgi:hypothetical protein